MHPFLRAYLAGIALPTMVIPLVIAGLALHHPAPRPFHVEEVIIFPIGLAPNAWGLWNMLYLWVRRHRELPIGAFGAVLVLFIAPAAFALQVALDKVVWTLPLVAAGLPLTFLLYYLAWKHVVARLNGLLGIG
jgi:hypothetical protein